MPLTDEQKNAVAAAAIVAGGAGLGYAIYKVVAATKATQKPPPPPGKRYRCTGAPSFTCVEDPAGPYTTLNACVNACKPSGPGLPQTISVKSYATNVVQRLGFLHTSPPNNQLINFPIDSCLYYLTLYGDDTTGHSQGYNTFQAYFIVEDASGKSVPNVPVLVWPLQVQDDQGGVLFINGSPRSASSPLIVTSDSQGMIHIWFEYHETDPATLQILCRKHGMGCYIIFGGSYGTRVGDYNYPGCCGYAYVPLPVPTIPGYVTKNAETEARTRTVHLEFQGAPLHATEIVFSVKFQSICIW